MSEFLSNFPNGLSSGKIIRNDWNLYYAAVSLSIDNDDHFVLLMKNLWRLDN